jgi:ABC-type multidrug transport system fused ATPase/permease subunit
VSAAAALLARVRPHRRALGAAVALGLLGSAAGLAQPLAARSVLEALAADDALTGPLVVLGGLVVAGTLVSLVHFWLLERTAQRIVVGARRGLAARLLRLRLAELDRQAPGDLVARATSDTTLLGQVTSSGLVQLVNGAGGLAGAIVLMGVVDLPLLAATLAVLGVIGGAVALLMPRIARAMERAQAAVGDLGAALERCLGAIRTVKASGAEPREIARLSGAADAAYAAGLRSARHQAVVGASTGLTVQVAFLTVLGFGGARVAQGSLAMADLVAFLLYLFYLAEPIAQLAQGATQLQGGLAAIRRLDGVERLEIEPVDEGAPPAGARVDVAP